MFIGYACILLGVPECSLKSLTLKNANRDNLNKVILHNLVVLDKVIDWKKTAGRRSITPNR
jgi:UV DNA damage endonuclease